MNIFIYSDESGVFDRNHNDYFIFAGVICFGKKEKDDITRKYAHVENVVRTSGGIKGELKGSNLSNKNKGKIFRSLNNVYKFCVRIKEKDLHSDIFENKKHKQRYLDYAYKMALKRCFETLIDSGKLNPNDVEGIYLFVDEHTTATDGIYELRENLLNEFKYGTYNYTWLKKFPPIFPRLSHFDLKYCNSQKVYLVRAADIICNHCYHNVLSNNGSVKNINNMFVLYLPSNVIGAKGLSFFNKETE